MSKLETQRVEVYEYNNLKSGLLYKLKNRINMILVLYTYIHTNY